MKKSRCIPEKMHLKLIEPLRELFKEEVRELGIALGIDEESVWRHPFPGPGLMVRVLGEISVETGWSCYRVINETSPARLRVAPVHVPSPKCVPTSKVKMVLVSSQPEGFPAADCASPPTQPIVLLHYRTHHASTYIEARTHRAVPNQRLLFGYDLLEQQSRHC